MAKTPAGVEVRGNNIRIKFTWQGERCPELLNLEPTEKNISYAADLVKLIKAEINQGNFNYAKHFPNSPRIITNQLQHWIDIWIDEKRATVTPETLRGYISRIENHIRPRWAGQHPADVQYDDLLHWKNTKLNQLSTKFIREILNIFSGIMTLCQRQKLISDNPLDWITLQDAEAPEPDPFTLAEIAAICRTPTKYPSDQRLAVFSLFTGTRPSEALALSWDDVDLDNREIWIRRAVVRGTYKITKTKRSNRCIELLPPAVEALRQQLQATGTAKPVPVDVLQRDNRTIRKEQLRLVWMNPRADTPYKLITTYGTGFWNTFLKLAGVKHRPFSHCRHTFASQMLSLPDIPDSWIVNQMGHTDTSMLYRKYGKLMQQRNRLSLADLAFERLTEREPALKALKKADQ